MRDAAYGYMITVDLSLNGGTVRKLGTVTAYAFTVSPEGILSDPPASNLPIKLRHYLETTYTRLVRNSGQSKGFTN